MSEDTRDEVPDTPPVDAGSQEPPDVVPDPPIDAGPPQQTVSYEACTESQLIGCDYIHVTARDVEADLCFQLSLESCDGGNRSLAVETPRGWRLASGSVLAGADECIPGDFDIRSAPATDASGTIRWNVEARPPEDLVIDVRLVLSPPPEQTLPRQASLSSSVLAGPLAECDD